ncbi:MAG TPA: FAD-binding oxidoreductase, partial [Longimicrobiales bacterium]|nr:FAD-binding oxidoreductase [Longimicrobiales bacterium]
LPWDPPAANGATIGAIISHAAAGPLRFGYGTPRDHVLGLTFATGDGRLLSVGGRVVKNVAGYDIGKLIVGSRGTLAIVVSAYLRLRALPERDVTVVCCTPEISAATELAWALTNAEIPAVALELLSPALATASGLRDGWTVLARYHGSGEATQAAVDAARVLAAGGRVAFEESTGNAMWSRLSALEAGAPLVVRCANRPNRLEGTLAIAETVAAALATDRIMIAAHAGDGIVRIMGDGTNPGAAGAVLAVRDRLTGEGGTVSVARAPAGMAVEPFGDTGVAGQLMRRLKEVFDPAGVLAPGRFA